MSMPVGILVIPSVAIGGALMFGGESSPWARFFAPLFGEPAVAGAAPVSEGATSAIVFILVVAGFAIAWWRYATQSAQRDAVERLHGESLAMPAILTNLFYFDALIELLFVRPAQWLGTIAGRTLDPHVIDGAVRDVAYWARWLGTLVRSLQTGFVRAYALILVFGAAGFIVYYAIAGATR